MADDLGGEAMAAMESRSGVHRRDDVATSDLQHAGIAKLTIPLEAMGLKVTIEALPEAV